MCLALPRLAAEPAGSSCRVPGSRGHVWKRRWHIWLGSRQRRTSKWRRTSFEPARAGQWFGQSHACCKQVGFEELPFLPATTSSFLEAVQQKRSECCLGGCVPQSVPSSGLRLAAEQLNIGDIKTNTHPFRPILKLLDRLYQYEEDVEPVSSGMRRGARRCWRSRSKFLISSSDGTFCRGQGCQSGRIFRSRASVVEFFRTKRLRRLCSRCSAEITSPTPRVFSEAQVVTRMPTRSTITRTPTTTTRPATRTTSGGRTTRTVRSTTRRTNPLSTTTPPKSSRLSRRWRMHTSTMSTRDAR